MAAGLLHGTCFGKDAGARNPMFFRVAAAGDEGQLVCEAVALQCAVANRIVVAAGLLHGTCFGEDVGARNIAFFHVKSLQPVLLCTTKLALTTSQYYVELQSLHETLPSTTL